MRVVELIVLVGVVGLVVGFIVSVTRPRDGCGYKAECTNQLRQIHAYAVHYGDRTEAREFPIAPEPTPQAHESLNTMIRFEPEGLSPRMFVCPSSDLVGAEADLEDRFTLTSDTLSYAWVGTETRITATNRALASDKYLDGFQDAEGTHAGHPGGMNVLMTDDSVRWVPEDELPKPRMLPDGLVR